jgi:acetyl esterase/lipase
MKTVLYYFSKKMQKNNDAYYSNVDVQVSDEIDAFFDLPYLGNDNNPLALDVYRPKKYLVKKLPVIIMVHGGGLYVGNRKLENAISQEFANRGYLVFNLEYRLLTETDACGEISDICKGICQVENLIQHFDGDKNKVYLVAESAGVYLSMYAVAMHNSKKLRNKIGCKTSSLDIRRMGCFSGMFYTKKADLIGAVYPLQIYGKKCLDREFMKYMNPENPEVMSNLPPMLLTSSDADFLKKYTLLYAKALESNNHPCKLMYYTDNKELTHAFPSYRLDMKESIEVIEELAYHFFDV